MKQETLFGSLWRKTRRSLGRRPPSVMVAGTSARSGKTWIATAMCRRLHRRGMAVVPFQALSFSTEAARCGSGGSIALEQARQAEACRVAATTDMNPLRCVPAAGGGYDILAGGKPWRKIEGMDFAPILDAMSERIAAAYERLSAQSDLVIVDGMGGALELDQPLSSLANLALAERFEGRVLLTAAADRGGVFASLAGTMGMLPQAQQRLIQAFVINEFYGNPESFNAGVKIIEESGGRPCLGVLPHSRTIRLGNGSKTAAATISRDELRVVILDLPGRSSDGEFELLGEAEYVTEPTRYDPDVVIIPPTSSTLGDLLWMKRIGLDRWVLDRRKEGTAIWGLGGGCHLLGRFVSDPGSNTPDRQRVPGLGLLPMQTEILPERGRGEMTATLADKDIEFQVSVPRAPIESLAAGPSPFATIGGQPEGFRQRGIVGTIFEGSLKSPAVVAELLDEVLQRRSRPAKTVESAATREEHYEKLADWFEEYADVALFDELYLK
jgi:adenosylcobyric acid synthase